MAGSQAASEHRSQQRSLIALLLAELRKLWPSLWPRIPNRPGSVVPQDAADPVVALVTQYAQASSGLAADFYELEREASGVRSPFTVQVADAPSPEQIAGSLSWATSAPTESEAKQVPPSLEQALQRFEGAAQRLTTNTGRETVAQAVTDDREAIAWARVPTGATTCYFCALMCSRGAVYKSSAEAGGRNARGKRNKNAPGKAFLGEGEFKFHDHCDCQAIPIFLGQDYEPSEQVQAWDHLYTSSGASTLKEFRRAYEGSTHSPDKG